MRGESGVENGEREEDVLDRSTDQLRREGQEGVAFCQILRTQTDPSDDQ
jgi:hypothetical protein